MAASIEHYQLPLPKIEGAVRLLIVVAPYYRQIAEAQIAGARAIAAEAGATIDLVEVPGALEVPTAIGLAAARGLYDGYVALGCVIRGETTHYDTVCNDSSRGITLLGLQGHCIGNGILTVENYEQAEVRANPDGQNKGGGAAAAALHLIALKRGWEARTVGDSASKPDIIRLAGELDGQRGA
ncbi:6,7-dimethyl-8-ribityllumazine synthase [Paracoccus laeviglucosivorans]|uniref:6,7-dimethyl-8-ribityllumazine synthase n=1 Tax=Paracoccus laeviglucosivorans TaxID=1197861 RepID=A0A521BVU3_9RHOB|nr:6,7-dimethyl-8-ribityllumazine synthase [Paracoccus laeviglucosivorans]SMO50540.1 6,7-dimethyl-8-ribityllumazine synthase [Paracoccus laeviglucosivorans]